MNGKVVPFKYSVTVGEQNHLLVEFEKYGRGANNTEEEIRIYLIRGKKSNKFILVGFFNDIGMNQEGVEAKFEIHPITLYQTKRYGLKD